MIACIFPVLKSRPYAIFIGGTSNLGHSYTCRSLTNVCALSKLMISSENSLTFSLQLKRSGNLRAIGKVSCYSSKVCISSLS